MRRTTAQLSAAALVVAAALASQATAGDRLGAVPEARLFRAANGGQLAGIEVVVGHSEGKAAQATRLAVTDVVVRLAPVAAEMPIGVALALEEAAIGQAAPPLLSLDLLLVAGGRLIVEERARCAPWRLGASLCRLACGGGAVALARALEGRGVSLRLVVGDLTPGGPATGARLGSCAERADGFETSVAPRRGQRIVEVDLVQE